MEFMKTNVLCIVAMIFLLGVVGCGVPITMTAISPTEFPLLTAIIQSQPDPTTNPESDCERIAFVKANYQLNKNPDIYTSCEDGSRITRLTDDPASDLMPSWSPDASRIAFVSLRTGSSQIFVMKNNGLDQKQITFDNSNDWPVWLPDAKTIAFRTTDKKGFWWWRLLNLESDEIQNLTEPSFDFFYQKLSWSPDGKQIAYMSMEEQRARNDGSSQIHIRITDGTSDQALTDNIWANIMPVWSPDSQRIAFLSEMHGQYDIYGLYIINSDGTDLRQLTDAVYTDTGASYSWSGDGRTIAIGDHNIGRIMLIDLESGNLVELPVTESGETVFWPAWQS